MKILLNLFITVFTVLSLSGCGKNIFTSKKNSTISNNFGNDQNSSIDFSFNLPLPNITLENSQTYPLSGTCDPTAGAVKIVIGSPDVTKSFPCDSNGNFSGTINVSNVISNPPSILAIQGNLTASTDPSPVNDQKGPVSAPMATAPGGVIGGGSSYNLPINCGEANEVVSIMGNGIDPSPQTYTCTGVGLENFPLSLDQGVSLGSENNLTISSTDEYGNEAGSTTTVDVPIDTLAPTVSITNNGNIIQGQTANFITTVADDNITSLSYAVSVNSGILSPSTCTVNPCNVSVSGALIGPLTLTVATNAVFDDLNNTGPSSNETSTLTISPAGALGFNNPLSTINTQNVSSYVVDGVCDSALGNVDIIVDQTVNESVSCNAPGVFSHNIDLTGVTLSPTPISVSQGVNTVDANPLPINDQDPILNAPTIADENYKNGLSTLLDVNCSEAGEVVTFSNIALDPNPQMHTCINPGVENVTLNFAIGQETTNPNNVTVSSVDINENPTTNNTQFNLPIDNVAPTVSVAAGANIIQGDDATFTVTVTDGSSFTGFTPVSSSGVVSSSACSLSLCTVIITGASAGTLTLTVGEGLVIDEAGNSNLIASEDSLNVQATSLSIASTPVGTSLNALSYPVSGNCDANQGDVTITIGTPDVSSTVSCTGSPGSYTTTLNISNISSNQLNIVSSQNNNNVSPLVAPINDQEGPVSAPVATAPGGVIGGSSYNLPINCGETNEVVSIMGSGIDPSPQTYTCTGVGLENFPLSLGQGVSLGSENNLTISSTDEYGNEGSSTTVVDVPIDTLAPTVSITNNGNIIQGQTASFVITVADDNITSLSYAVSVNSGILSPSTCTVNPCNVSVSGALIGPLTLTVATNAVFDDLNNTGPSSNETNTLTVNPAGALGFNNPLSTINTQNVSSYVVDGVCDSALGNVDIIVDQTVNESVSCNAPGVFSHNIDLTGVTLSPTPISVSQGVNTVDANPLPINDQDPILNAPTIADENYKNGLSTLLDVNCSEAGEVVTFSNIALDPNPQMHTCINPGVENVTLNFAIGQETTNPNNVTVSSVDINENPTTNNTQFNLPIDNVAPTVSVAAGANIIQGDDATFTVTVTDGSSFTSFTPVSSSGVVSSSACSLSPCTVIITGASAGTLTLTVGEGLVIDEAGNSNLIASEDNLNVQATSLSIASTPVGTSLNALSYPVSGNCDANQGDVTITIGTPDVSSTVSCTGNPGSYTTTLNISNISSNQLNIVSSQNNNNVSPLVAPINDQEGPVSAPMATAPGGVIGGGSSYNLPINCGEANEVVSIMGNGIDPSPQTYTCTGVGLENFPLSLDQGVSLGSENNLTISSTDEHGNEAGNTTVVDVPIDTLAPTVSITNNGNIIQGQTASFVITVTDDNITSLSYAVSVNSGILSPSTCTVNPCNVSVSGALIGPLTLTVATNAVFDDLNNTGPSSNETSTLTISPAGALGFNNPLSTINTQNVSSYVVDGVCDSALGNVDIIVNQTVNESVSCNDPGVFSHNIDLTGVTLSPTPISVSQGVNTVDADPFPINDQEGPASAPMATAPGGVIGGGSSYNLPINCGEANEVVSIMGNGIDPSPQTYTCTGVGLENFPLSLDQGVSLSSENNLTISSTDEYGNEASNTTVVDVPIDTLAPTVSITNNGNIIQGQTASFVITITDDNITSLSYAVSVSSGTLSSNTCTANPCNVSVSGALIGPLTLTVATNAVFDDLNNTGPSSNETNTLTVNPAGALGFNNPLSTINTQNVSSYVVDGVCDSALGNVDIIVDQTVNESVSCNAPGVFSHNIDLTGVTLSPTPISVSQGVNTVDANPLPINDQDPILNAPTIADENYKNGLSTLLDVNCSEAGEVVTFSNIALDPNPQMHTCINPGVENVTLNFAIGQETTNPNNVTVSSVDINENPTTNNTQFNLPIDNVAPTVSVAAGANIIQGDDATFTVTVTDGSSFTSFTPVSSSGVVSSSACSLSPCTVIITGASAGTLTLTVGEGLVIDEAGNSNLIASEDNLNVQATSLSIASTPVGTSLNALSYPVSGNCDANQGDVTITIGTPDVSSTVSCTGNPGSYTTTLNISNISSNQLNIVSSQNNNNVSPLVAPINDQEGPVSAPVATAPGGVIGGGSSYNLPINCGEANEVVSIMGNGIDPSPQTYTCTGVGLENFPLSLDQGVSLGSENNLTISSTDEYGNEAGSTTTVDVPIDTLAPTISITNNGNIIQGQTANFIITVADDNITQLSYTVSTSGVETSSYSCSINPCSITTGAIQLAGELILTVAANSVADDLGNTGDSVLRSSSLTVSPAGALGFNNPLSTINTQNVNSYVVDGVCDSALGNVDIIVDQTINESVSCNAPGVFSHNIDLTGVNLSPTPISVSQGVKTVDADPFPINDQEGPVSAPVATAPGGVIGGSSYNLPINCGEANEVVSIMGNGIDPSPQTYTCTGVGLENFPLSLDQGVSLGSENNLTISSTDEYGNEASNTTVVDVPIDTLAPTVSITNNGNIIQGQTASFVITVTDDNITQLSYTVSTSGVETSSYSCSINPCSITTGAIQLAGELILTVAANSVADDLGNTGDSVLRSSSLTVSPAGALGFNNPLSTINTQNVSSYVVDGVCDSALGNVDIIVNQTVNESASCNAPGVFSHNIDLTGVTLSPTPISVSQGVNTVDADPFPINDQEGPVSAPVATAPGGVIGGSSYNLPINCGETNEVVSIMGNGIDPSPQTYTCTGVGLENFPLSLDQGVSLSSENNLTISSTDEYGNEASNTTVVDVPIDTLAPTVSITNNGNIIQGQTASFVITVTDDNITQLSYTVSTSGVETSSYSCSINPCSITTGAIQLAGELILTVAANSVADDLGNTGDSVLRSSSLTVNPAGALGFNNPLSTINTQNVSSYSISGVCDSALGNVDIIVNQTVNESVSCNAPGVFSHNIDLTGVTLSPTPISVSQGVNTVDADPFPINDQNPILNAPTIVDQSYKNGLNTLLDVNCSEAGEVVTFSNIALDPNPQMHTCINPGIENVTLNFTTGQETTNPNNVTVSSVDINENPTTNNTQFNLPIDNVAPTVSVAAGANIIQGDDATFTVTVTDGSSFTSFTPVSSSGVVSSSACSLSPCTVIITGASAGTLTLTVGEGLVIDEAGNSNLIASEDSLNVQATNLSIASTPVGTSLNALSYPVSGNCDANQGDVTITIGTPDVSSTVSCTGSPGSYTTTLNISNVSSNQLNIVSSQNNNNVSPLVAPINDQEGPVSAPVATAPGGVIGGGLSYDLPINCGEANEVVSIMGSGIDPSPQTYTCTGVGLENFPLSLDQGVSLGSENNLTISSTDEYGNEGSNTTVVDVPIDTLAPTVSITNNGNIIQGQTASFVITVTDDNITSLSYAVSVSSGTLSSNTCTANPCNVSVNGALFGPLTLTVAANAVFDDLNNTGPSSNETNTLTVIDDPPPTITGVSIGSTDGDIDFWYEESDTVIILVKFSENVTVNTTGGTPSIPVELTSDVKNATYDSGSGTSTLSFNFVVSSGDEQCDENLSLGGLALNGGTIKDTLGQDSNNSELALSVLGAQIDAVKPSLSSPLSITTNNSYDDRSATVSWTTFDNCGTTIVKKSIGNHNGSTCNTPSSVSPYENLGDLNSFQAQSGVSPFNTFNLSEGVDYCSSVIAIDQAGNESAPSESPLWNYYKSCSSYLADGVITSGTYTIHNDTSLGPLSVYCDMVTQGGGWTLVIRYDKDHASSSFYNLPTGSGQKNINLADMSTIQATSNMSASIDIAPFISNGATHLMHVGTASGSTSYDRVYFSEIYQVVLDNPDNIFELSFDTNNSESIVGSATNWSATLKNRWFESDFTLMTNTQVRGGNGNSQRAIDGGEGRGMWTNGSREGALYSSGVGTNGGINGHTSPKVQWGFVGKDNTQQNYIGETHIGTYCRYNSRLECVPSSRMNLMFVR